MAMLLLLPEPAEDDVVEASELLVAELVLVAVAVADADWPAPEP